MYREKPIVRIAGGSGYGPGGTGADSARAGGALDSRTGIGIGAALTTDPTCDDRAAPPRPALFRSTPRDGAHKSPSRSRARPRPWHARPSGDAGVRRGAV